MFEHYFAADSIPQLPATDPQAEQLNQRLLAEAPAIYELLSPCGKSLYYPKQGLLLQAEEADKSRYNGSVGIALDDAGKPMHYSSIARMLNLETSRCVPYASSYGLLPLRQLWGEQLLLKNPALQERLKDKQQPDQYLSLPVVTSGITHGLWIAFQMLLGRGDELLLPHLHWPNYRLIARTSCGARIKTYNTFAAKSLGDSGIPGLDMEAIRSALFSPGHKKVLLFNFPHNPTGYSPQKSEIKVLQKIFLEAADAGKHIAIICDDAYWGLCYEAETEQQSLFAFVAGLHPHILALKIDGATKEDFVWGLRIGFITFGLPVPQSEAADAAPLSAVLENKAGACVRLSTSNCSRLSQEILLATYRDEETRAERRQLQEVLSARYRCLRRCLSASRTDQEPDRSSSPLQCGEYLRPLPFNSGYFMTFEILREDLPADGLRKYLLAQYDIGLISLQDRYLRFAFSAVAESDIPHVLETLHRACGEFVQLRLENR